MADNEQKPIEPAVNPSAFSANLYNHDTKKWEMVPEDQVDALVRAGSHTFEQGVRIPVVSPDGKVGTIPAEQAHGAFNEGFRWVTANAKAANEEIQNDRILEKNFGDQTATAFVGGVLRGTTLGASDLALAGMGLGDVAREVQERNEGASTVGELTGIIASSLYGGGPVRAVQNAGKVLGRKVGVEAGLRISLRKIASQVGEQAAEGALFGAGKTVSEASLGQTDDVLDSLASNVGWGALVGGATGAAFGSAKNAVPYARELWEGATEKTGNFVAKLAKKRAEQQLIPVLQKAGYDELAKEVPELLDDPLATRLAATDKGTFKVVVKRAREEVSAAKATQKELIETTKETLKDASVEAKTQIANAVEKTAGDLDEATKVLYQDMKTYREQFDFDISGLSDSTQYPSVHGSTFTSKGENVVDRLFKHETNAGRTIAARVQRGLEMNGMESVGDELRFAAAMKRDIPESLISKLPEADQAAVRDFLNTLDDVCKRHPNLQAANSYRNLMDYTDAYNQFMGLYQKTIGKIDKDLMEVEGQVIINGKPLGQKGIKDLTRALTSPSVQEAYTVALANIEEFLPLMRRFSEGFADINAYMSAKDELVLALKNHLGKGADIDAEALGELFARLGIKGEQNIAKIKEMAPILAGSGDNILNQAQAVRQAMGHAPDAEFAMYGEVYDKLNKIKQVQRLESENGESGSGLLKLALRWVIPKRLKWLMPEAFEDMLSGGGDTVKRLQAFREAVSKGQQATNQAVDATVSSLTGKKASKIARAVVTESTSNRRKRVEATLKNLNELDPHQTAPQLDGMPDLTSGFQNRQQQVLNYLKQKAPQDPLMADSISLNNSGWVPSDSELMKFDRVLKAVDNPLNVMKSIQKGSVTQDEIETLKQIYPRHYQQLQNVLLDDIINNQRKLSYKQKLVIGTIFDLPTNYSMRPDFIQRMQELHMASEGGAPEGNQNNKTIKIDISSEQLMTDAQKVTYK